MFEAIIKDMNITKDELFFFGDSNVDADSIINNGLNGCIVTWGLKTKEELAKYDLPKIDKVEEISSIIEH